MKKIFLVVSFCMFVLVGSFAFAAPDIQITVSGGLGSSDSGTTIFAEDGSGFWLCEDSGTTCFFIVDDGTVTIVDAVTMSSGVSTTNVKATGNIEGSTYGSDGSVTDAELLYVDATSSIQTQLNARYEANDEVTFNAIVYNVLTSTPTASNWTWAVADNDNWDPANISGSTPYRCFYSESHGEWYGLINDDGTLLVSSMDMGGVVLGNADPDGVPGGIGFDGTDTFKLEGDGDGLDIQITSYTANLGGVSTYNLGTMDVTTTGEMLGGVTTYIVASGTTLNASQMYNSIVYVTGAAMIGLSSVADGMNVTVISTGANTVRVNPDDSDLFIADGTAGSDGDAITSTGAAGDMAVITYYNATGFYAATNGWTNP